MDTRQQASDRAGEQVADGTLTVEAAVAFSGVSRAQLYRHMANGELTFVKLGKRRLIPRNSLRALLANAVVTVVGN